MTDSSKDMVGRLCTLHQLKFSKAALPICKATSYTSAGKDQASIDARICHDMSIKGCLPNKSFLSGRHKPPGMQTAKLTLPARRITLMCKVRICSGTVSLNLLRETWKNYIHSIPLQWNFVIVS